MAHIADLLATSPNIIPLDNYSSVTSGLFPPTAVDSVQDPNKTERYLWRMRPPPETRKYQLFPTKNKLPTMPGRESPDPEQAFALAMARSNLADRPFLSTVMRLKSKEQSLIKRRKGSISDLGPMTTVQEIAMDSPTIPGRPPLHERSASAPGNGSSRQNSFGPGPAMTRLVAGESNGRKSPPPKTPLFRQRSNSSTEFSQMVFSSLSSPSTQGTASAPQRVAVKKPSLNKLYTEDIPPAVPPKSGRILGLENGRNSPQSRTPITPQTSSTNLSIQTTLVSSSYSEGRNSPLCTNITPTSLEEYVRTQQQLNSARYAGHRREISESSIIDRGRPTKRVNGSPVSTRRIRARPSPIAEPKLFETLPQGVKAYEARSVFDRLEIDALRQQAMGQVSRFEVLGMKDVEALSRELRALDERCEYLRRTHHSLRSGRHNLHERICSYLDLSRTAQFSPTSLLKQEEALMELDLSIDEWVNKLERAENRRTRVRQKLLEHVAAASTLQPPMNNGLNQLERAASRSLSMGENTPPRSPTKETPADLEQLTQNANPEEIDGNNIDQERLKKESIRIYADADIYALLADVEQNFSHLGMEDVRKFSQGGVGLQTVAV